MQWIAYGSDAVVSKLKQQAAKTKTAAAGLSAAAEKCMPHVIQHDEETAAVQAGQQATFAPVAKAQTIWVNLPWADWAKSMVAEDMAAQSTDIGAINQVMRALFTSEKFATHPVAMRLNKDNMKPRASQSWRTCQPWSCIYRRVARSDPRFCPAPTTNAAYPSR